MKNAILIIVLIIISLSIGACYERLPIDYFSESPVFIRKITIPTNPRFGGENTSGEYNIYNENFENLIYYPENNDGSIPPLSYEISPNDEINIHITIPCYLENNIQYPKLLDKTILTLNTYYASYVFPDTTKSNSQNQGEMFFKEYICCNKNLLHNERQFSSHITYYNPICIKGFEDTGTSSEEELTSTYESTVGLTKTFSNSMKAENNNNEPNPTFMEMVILIRPLYKEPFQDCEKAGCGEEEGDDWYCDDSLRENKLVSINIRNANFLGPDIYGKKIYNIDDNQKGFDCHFYVK